MTTHLERLGFHSIYVTFDRALDQDNFDNNPSTYKNLIEVVMDRIEAAGQRRGYSVWDLSAPPIPEDGTLDLILEEASDTSVAGSTNYQLINQCLFFHLDGTAVNMTMLD